MFSENMSIVECAQALVKNGFTPVPLHPNSKVPKERDWNKKKPDFALFKDANLGVMGLTDIDLDHPAAQMVAKFILPKTGLVFGKEGTQFPTHHMYITKSKKGYKKLTDLQGHSIVEYRPLFGTHHTMFPPSIHPSGAKLKFFKCDKPTEVDEKILMEKVLVVHAITVLGLSWCEGSRQDAIMALTGGLCYAGWDRNKILEFTNLVLDVAVDHSELEMRRKGVKGTIDKYDQGDKVTGFTTLKEIIGEDVVGKVMYWLNIKGKEHKDNEILMQDGTTFIVKMSAKGVPSVVKLCSFEIEPKRAVIVDGQGEFLTLRLKTNDGTFEVEFPPESWVSATKFKSLLALKGGSQLSYFGNDVQVQMLKYFVSGMMSEVPVSKSVPCVGIHKDMFVTEKGALKNGRVRMDYVAIGADVRTELLEAEARKDFDSIKEVIDRFNGPEIVHPVLGWVSACFYKSALHDMKEVSGFPLLVHEGEAGSGKTQTAEMIAEIFGLSTNFSSCAHMTKFVMEKKPSLSNCLPFIMEEYKPARMSPGVVQRISGLIRDAYTQAAAEKGQKDQKLVSYPRRSPILICGEEGFDNEAAHLERIVQCSFSKKQSKIFSESFRKLRKGDLRGLGKTLLLKRLSVSDDRIREVYLEELGKVDAILETRVRNNAAILRLGLRFLGEVLGMDFDLDYVDLALTSYTRPEGKEIKLKTTVGAILESFGVMALKAGTDSTATMYKQDALHENIHYKIVNGKELGLHIPSIYPMFTKWFRDRGNKIDFLDRNSFVRQLKKEEYYLRSGTVKMNNGPRKCFIIDIRKAEKDGVSLEGLLDMDYDSLD